MEIKETTTQVCYRIGIRCSTNLLDESFDKVCCFCFVFVFLKLQSKTTST